MHRSTSAHNLKYTQYPFNQNQSPGAGIYKPSKKKPPNNPSQSQSSFFFSFLLSNALKPLSIVHSSYLHSNLSYFRTIAFGPSSPSIFLNLFFFFLFHFSSIQSLSLTPPPAPLLPAYSLHFISFSFSFRPSPLSSSLHTSLPHSTPPFSLHFLLPQEQERERERERERARAGKGQEEGKMAASMFDCLSHASSSLFRFLNYLVFICS